MSAMRIARFDPSPFDFPRPKIPLLPNKLSLKRKAPSTHAGSGEVTATPKSFASFMRGRYALCEAYSLSGIRAGTALMAPAYHCVTMLDPAIVLGAEILLYPLNKDLSPDLSQFDSVLTQVNSPVKALLATHFFGLIQDFTTLKTWCDARGITLIEDCSHVLFCQDYQAFGAGQVGKFVTSSPYKFFACEDGGLLNTSEPSLLANTDTQKRTLLDELRGIKRFVEKLRAISPPTFSDIQCSALFRTPETPAELPITDYCNPSSYFVPSDQKKAALRTSRWTAGIESLETIITERRKNYATWAAAVETVPNCSALYPQLPETCVPYMFPLLIDKPTSHFYRLKQLGVPIWRWDEMAISTCHISKRYQLHLLHLPCHQSLSNEQMTWMISAVRKVLLQPVQESR